MGMDKRTIKIVVIVCVVVLVIGAIIGTLLALLLPYRYVELEVWPRSEEYNVEQPLIQFRTGDAGSWHVWYQRINNFLRQYETAVPEDPPRAPCSTQNREEQVFRSDTCNIAMRLWAPCTADEYYGYYHGKPCVFLRLNHIHYWVPHPYNMTSGLPFPPDMPDHIRQYLMQRPGQQFQQFQLSPQFPPFGDYVWVSCGGEFNADQENIGTIQYIPAGFPPGFPTSRLHTADKIPYYSRNMPEQTPGPLVAVHFENPRRGVLINVECRIWTRDLYLYDRYSRYGRARFELWID